MSSVRRCLGIVRRFASLGACIAILAWPAEAEEASPALVANLPLRGTHFIVLLDDSGDMRGRRKAMAEVAEQAIFEVDEQNGKPVFDAGRGDRISVLFFGIEQGCREKTRNRSASPEGLFEWAPAEQLAAVDDFRSFLVTELEKSCRFRSSGTPANTAPLTSLVAAQEHLAAGKGSDQVFERTLVVLVSNNLSNGPPSGELKYLRKNQGVDDTEETEKLVGEIAHWFGNPVETAWARKEKDRPDNPITAQYFRIQPLRTELADQALDFNSPIEVDRIATARDAIQVIGHGESAVLSIDAQNIRPLVVRWNFAGEGGTSPWKIGGHEAPAHQEEDLSVCQPPVCRYEGHKLKVDLLAALGEASILKATDALPPPGRVTFTVGFAYPSKFYSQSAIFSPSRTVTLRPVEPTKVRSGWLLQPIDYKLDNPGLLRWYDPADGSAGLSQAVAAARARSRLNVYQVLELGLLLAALLALLWVLAHRGFVPEVVVSTVQARLPIDGANGAPFLVGRVSIHNSASQPWLHRWFGRSFEVRHRGSLALAFENWGEVGRRLNLCREGVPVGFLPRGQATISATLGNIALHDGTEIPLYLDPSQIDDLNQPGSHPTGAVLKIEVQATLDWGGRHHRCNSQRQELRVTIEPEEPREPIVDWVPHSDVEFQGDESEVELGVFVLRSQSRKLFAQPFVADYEMRLSNSRKEPLSATALALGGVPAAGSPTEPAFRLEVPPRNELRIPVWLDCTLGQIANPSASKETYHLSLMQAVSGSPGTSTQTFNLRRDSRAADLELKLRQAIAGEDDELEYEIYWEGGRVCRRRVSSSETDVKSEGWSLAMPEGFLRVTPGAQSQVPVILQIDASNTARSGQGSVQLRLEVKSRFSGLSGSAPTNLVVFRTLDGQIRSDFTIGPGKTERGEIFLNSQHLPSLTTGYGTCAIAMEIHATIDPGNGEPQQARQVKLEFSLRLSEMPNDLWLCIDFGTSAVAVAHGKDTDLEFANLQAVRCFDSKSFAALEGRNSEFGTPFLPSTVFFPGPDDKSGRPGQPGTPWGATDDRPGESSFVNLPARVHDIRDHPMRVAYSLKSWLSDGRKYLIMPEPIQCHGRRERALDLESVLASVYRALTEGYILADSTRQGSDRLVLTHPNCFTGPQRERLSRVAFDALGIGSGPLPDTRYLQLKNPKRVALLSESDAVGYYHCWKRNESRNLWQGRGPERIVVYDLGAGTLDLSLVEVHWTANGIVQEFRVKARLGVALAGDAIDERLCRIIDAAIRRGITELPPKVTYRLPLVKKKGMDSGPAAERPTAIQEFRTRLRSAKYKWAKEVVEQGGAEGTALDVELGAVRETALVKPEKEAAVAMEQRDSEAAGLYTNRAGEHRLRLSGPDILGDPKMAELLRFLTRTVIKELMSLSGVAAESVDTLLISGRGALWPGVWRSVGSQFPNADTPQWKENEMKLAVARGAVAGQLPWFVQRHVDDAPQPRWGLLHDRGRKLILEDSWTGRIPVVGDKVQLFQVGISAPDPVRDRPLSERLGIPGSLRSTFYTRLVRDDITLPEGTQHIRLERTGEGLGATVRVFASGNWLAIDTGGDPPGPPTWLASYLLEEEA